MPDEPRMTIRSASRVSPEEVQRHTFATVRRGFAAEEVRAFLDVVADHLRNLADQEAELRRELGDALHRAANPVLDEATLAGALGAETARVLRSAQDAARDVIEKAESDAGELRAEAKELYDAATARAERLVEEASSRAQAALDEALADGESRAQAMLATAREEIAALEERTREECRSMVEEAQSLRTKVLADLAKRRKVLHAQIEQLRAGRERLADTVRGVRSSIDTIADDLFRAEDQARLAAEAAGRESMARRDDVPPEEMAAALQAELAEQAAEEVPVGSEPSEAVGDAGAETAAEAAPAAEAAEAEGPVAAAVEAGNEPTGETPAVRILPKRPAPTAERPGTGTGAGTGTGEVGEPTAVVAAVASEEGEGAAAGTGAPAATPADEKAEVHEPVHEPGPASKQRGRKASATQEPEAGTPETGSHAGGPGSGKAGGRERKRSNAARREANADVVFAKLRAAAEEAEEAGEAGTPGAVEESPIEQPPDAGERLSPSGGTAMASTPEAGEASDGESRPQDASAVALRAEMTGPVVTALSRRVKRQLQDVQNELLDRLRANGSTWSSGLLPDAAKQRHELATAALAHLEQAALAGRSFVDPASSVTPDAAMVERTAGELADAVIVPLRKRLEGDGGAASEEGAGAEHVGASFREWKGERIERLVTDHVIAAFGLGTLAAAKELTWTAHSEEGDPCPDCEDNSLSGAVPAGEPFPTGHLRPPAHPGCRCVVVAAVP